jgi:hypothetical protein
VVCPLRVLRLWCTLTGNIVLCFPPSDLLSCENTYKCSDIKTNQARKNEDDFETFFGLSRLVNAKLYYVTLCYLEFAWTLWEVAFILK